MCPLHQIHETSLIVLILRQQVQFYHVWTGQLDGVNNCFIFELIFDLKKMLSMTQ